MEIIKNQHFHLSISGNSNIRIFEDKSMIRFDESRETYDSTNPRFGIEYSNIRIRSNKNAVHWQYAKVIPFFVYKFRGNEEMLAYVQTYHCIDRSYELGCTQKKQII